MGVGNDCVRVDGLGFFSVLPDELIFHILSMMNERDLSSASCASRLLRLLCCEEALWMGLALKCHERASSSVRYLANWRQTCLSAVRVSACASTLGGQTLVPAFNRCSKLQYADRYPDESTIQAGAIPPSPVPGFCSSFLYRRWYRSHMDLQFFYPSPGVTCMMHRQEDAGRLDTELFAKSYDQPCLPVIIEHAMGGWKVEELQLEALAASHGSLLLQAGFPTGSLSVSVTLSDYLDYSIRQWDEEPLYIFDAEFGEAAPDLLQKYQVPLFLGRDHLAVLGSSCRPPFRWLVVGSARCGASWHVDPNLTSAWNALVQGTKRWALYPPHITPPGVHLIEDMDGNTGVDPSCQMTALRWFLEVYPSLSRDDQPHLEFVQQPGQMVFVPGGWWHCVLNLTTSVAVTQNFVSDSNLARMLAHAARGPSYYFEHIQEFYPPGSAELWSHWCRSDEKLDCSLNNTSTLIPPKESMKRRRSNSDSSFQETNSTTCLAPASPSTCDVGPLLPAPVTSSKDCLQHCSSQPLPRQVRQVPRQLSSLQIHVDFPPALSNIVKHQPPVIISALQQQSGTASQGLKVINQQEDHTGAVPPNSSEVGKQRGNCDSGKASKSIPIRMNSSGSSISSSNRNKDSNLEDRKSSISLQAQAPPSIRSGDELTLMLATTGGHAARDILHEMASPWTCTPWLGELMRAIWVQNPSWQVRTALQRCFLDSCHGAAWGTLLLPLLQQIHTTGAVQPSNPEPSDLAVTLCLCGALSPSESHACTLASQCAALPTLQSQAVRQSQAKLVECTGDRAEVPNAGVAGCEQDCTEFHGMGALLGLSPEECMPILGSTCLVFLTKSGTAVKLFLHQRLILCHLMRDIHMHVWNLAAKQNPWLAQSLLPVVAAGSLHLSVLDFEPPTSPDYRQPISDVLPFATRLTAAAAAPPPPTDVVQAAACCKPDRSQIDDSVSNACLLPFLVSASLPQGILPWADAYPKNLSHVSSNDTFQRQCTSAAALGAALARLHSLSHPATSPESSEIHSTPHFTSTASTHDWAALLSSGHTVWHDCPGNIWVSQLIHDQLTTEHPCTGGNIIGDVISHAPHKPAAIDPHSPQASCLNPTCARRLMGVSGTAPACRNASYMMLDPTAKIIHTHPTALSTDQPAARPPTAVDASSGNAVSAWWPFLQFLRHRMSVVTAQQGDAVTPGLTSDRDSKWRAAVKAYLPHDPAVLVGIGSQQLCSGREGFSYSCEAITCREPAPHSIAAPHLHSLAVPVTSPTQTVIAPLLTCSTCDGQGTADNAPNAGLAGMCAEEMGGARRTCRQLYQGKGLCDRPPMLLHGDLTAHNIHVRTGNNLISPGYKAVTSMQEATSPAVAAQSSGNSAAVQASTILGAAEAGDVILLDLGDAGHGDPLYDFIAMHGTCFRGNSVLLSRFWENYRVAAGMDLRRPQRSFMASSNSTSEQQLMPLSYVAMCYTLLHEEGDMLLEELSKHCSHALAVLDLPAMAAHIWGVLDEL